MTGKVMIQAEWRLDNYDQKIGKTSYYLRFCQGSPHELGRVRYSEYRRVWDGFINTREDENGEYDFVHSGNAENFKTIQEAQAWVESQLGARPVESTAKEKA